MYDTIQSKNGLVPAFFVRWFNCGRLIARANISFEAAHRTVEIRRNRRRNPIRPSLPKPLMFVSHMFWNLAPNARHWVKIARHRTFEECIDRLAKDSNF